jgi:protein involved in polysaccharide export with SLBB domain
MRATRYLCSIAGLLAIGAAVYAGQPSTQPSGEIYVGGQVARPGVYSITGHPMDVLQAIDQAGPDNAANDYEVTIVHTVVPKKLERITRFNSFRALKDVPKESTQLEPGDQVTLTQIKK